MTRRILLCLLVGITASFGTAAEENSCVTCHGNSDMIDDAQLLAIVESFEADVHAEAGLSCHDCHGGNPDPVLAEDMFAAMDEDFQSNPYQGVPERTGIPAFCGRCHSDPLYMRRYRPSGRVDQEREYWTSQHGVLLKQGDTKVATCTDCHGIHGIRQASNPEASVYPTRVADTCGHCHADPEHMAGYVLDDGRPLPVDQVAKWTRSVHAAAMFEKEDLSAPTCNDCHGNHGAAPPGLESIVFVCGQCHGRESTLFRQSAKHDGWNTHNEENLPSMGPEGCDTCHASIEPQAAITSLSSLPECSTCHNNHGIVRPTVAHLSPLPETPCAFCHENTGSIAAEFPDPEPAQALYAERREVLLAEAAELGLSGDDRFDWLVDRTLELDTHTLSPDVVEGSETVLRPDFAKLFDKFRIGKTYYTYVDPATNETIRERLVRCTDCHGPEPQLAAEPRGLNVATDFVEQMHELTALTAQAERLLLRARRGGVEVREAMLDLDQAVDAQIGLEVLVHTFSSADDGAFAKQREEGLTHARAAIASGNEALEELTYRRQGLVIALIIILLVLIGLALKIRHLSRQEVERARAQSI